MPLSFSSQFLTGNLVLYTFSSPVLQAPLKKTQPGYRTFDTSMKHVRPREVKGLARATRLFNGRIQAPVLAPFTARLPAAGLPLAPAITHPLGALKEGHMFQPSYLNQSPNCYFLKKKINYHLFLSTSTFLLQTVTKST